MERDPEKENKGNLSYYFYYFLVFFTSFRERNRETEGTSASNIASCSSVSLFSLSLSVLYGAVSICVSARDFLSDVFNDRKLCAAAAFTGP